MMIGMQEVSGELKSQIAHILRDHTEPENRFVVIAMLVFRKNKIVQITPSLKTD